MTNFIGRTKELKMLANLPKKHAASLITLKGRRRIGKSRLIQEFAKEHSFKHTYLLSGIPPTPETTAQSQRDEFASQLAKETGLPKVIANDWNELFVFLADRVKVGKTLLLFDEISWMGSKDPDFLGKLKNIWDLHFKKNEKLILVLCGSISSWIDKNILANTGFVGRITMDFTLKEMPLHDCQYFWRSQTKNTSAYEKFKILSITGGIPLYLENIDPNLSSTDNIRSLCFSPQGLLSQEFERLFSDLFSKRSLKYKKILLALNNNLKTQPEIAKSINLEFSSDLNEYLDELIKAGFIERDYTWSIKTKKTSKLSHYRISDNYTRFYLKYIMPNQEKIKKIQYSEISISELPGWSSIMGLQFENLVLNNRQLLWKLLNIKAEQIIFDNPYFQRKTLRHEGCQIDYMIQTNHNILYICEIKFTKDKIGMNIIDEIEAKIKKLAIPKNFSYRTILIHVNGITDQLEDSCYFANVIDFGIFFLSK